MVMVAAGAPDVVIGMGADPAAVLEAVDRRVAKGAPPWLTTLASWQGADRQPGPVVLDAILTAGAVAAVTASGRIGVASAALVVLFGLLFGLFRRRTTLESQGVGWYAKPLGPTLLATWGVLALAEPLGLVPSRALLAVAIAAAVLLGVHGLGWLFIAAARRRGVGLGRTLVIGTEERIALLRHRLGVFPEGGLRFVAGLLPDQHDTIAKDESNESLVAHILDRSDAEHVLFTTDSVQETVLRQFVRHGRGRADCSIVLPLGGLSAGHARAHIGDLGVLPLRLVSSPASVRVKRVVDIIGSLLLLAAVSPVLLSAMLAIRLSDRGPSLFRQPRVGKDGRTFTILKLRSMVVDAEARRTELAGQNVNEGLLFKLERDPRITPVGAIIRRFSIDELPQLWNVLRGDMSLVGPRPLPVSPEEFEPAARVRHSVAPGITGLWQVNGANALRYADMLELDMAYVVTHSLGVDLQLMLRTIPALLVRRSAY